MASFLLLYTPFSISMFNSSRYLFVSLIVIRSLLLSSDMF